MTVNKNESKKSPAYLSIYVRVREDIVNGVYRFGQKLPSKRAMSDKEGVSTVTVEHAYALLCDEGYIEPRERSGYFVIFTTDGGFAFSAEEKNVSLVSDYHRSGELPEFPLSVLTKTMRRVMSDYGGGILERSPNGGCVQLKDAIRRYLMRNRGINAQPEQIIIGSGSEYLYGLIVKMLGRDCVYAIESPSYKMIEQVYSSYEVPVEKLPLGNDGIDSTALRRSKARVLHISPYRSFPSGVTATASKRHEYIRWASEHDRFIVEDDFESEFTLLKKAEETLFSLSGDDNVIYVNTFSKTVSPSLRVGYMILPERFVPLFNEKVGFYSCTVPTFIQLVLAELISGGDLERHINRVRRIKRNGKKPV